MRSIYFGVPQGATLGRLFYHYTRTYLHIFLVIGTLDDKNHNNSDR